MDDHDDWMAECFEAQRSRMRALAYRMLGSLSEPRTPRRSPGCASAAPG
jgi:hypothetical protein